MPYIKITDKLRETIKEKRKERQIRGDFLSKELGMGASYISQIENGRTSRIDVDILHKIFKKIINLPEEQFNDFMTELLQDLSIELSEKDIEEEHWMMVFDLKYRKLPIPDELVTYILEKLSLLEMTPENLINEVNKNKFLEDKDSKNKEKNKPYPEIKDNKIIGYSIRFNLETDFLDKIINKHITKIDYITMEGIIFNLIYFELKNEEETRKKTDEILHQYDFYTILDRNRIIEQYAKEKLEKKESFKLYELDPVKYIRDYGKIFDEIKKHFNTAREFDIEYSLKQIAVLNKNLESDAGFMFALFGFPFYKLDKVSRETKLEVLKEIRNIINKSKSNIEGNDQEE